jgi:hypothetical protein
LARFHTASADTRLMREMVVPILRPIIFVAPCAMLLSR